jgi:methylmalonyl-CoA mutase N-terminal domain/subunit
VLGGTQSLHTNSFDEALALPTEHSAKLALRTQQIIAKESGVADVIDPLGGSYYLESLTDKLEEEAQGYIEKIQKLGGVLPAIQKGYQQAEIEKASYEEHLKIERGEKIIVGVNRFVELEDGTHNIHKIDSRIISKRIKELLKFRKNRNNRRVADSLKRLKDYALGKKNIIEATTKCLESQVTLGEISNALRELLGRYKMGMFHNYYDS